MIAWCLDRLLKVVLADLTVFVQPGSQQLLRSGRHRIGVDDDSVRLLDDSETCEEVLLVDQRHNSGRLRGSWLARVYVGYGSTE